MIAIFLMIPADFEKLHCDTGCCILGTAQDMIVVRMYPTLFWGPILLIILNFLGLENQALIGTQAYEAIRTIVLLVNYHALSATSTRSAEAHLVFSFLISMYHNCEAKMYFKW